MIARALAVCAVALLGAACAGGPTATPTPRPSPSASPSAQPSPSPSGPGATTPEDAVKALLPVQPGTTPCRPAQGTPFQDPACPLSDRLRQRLSTVQVHADPICRCQNVPGATDVHQATTSGSTATVAVTFEFQPAYDVTFTTVEQSGRWLVDDASCGTPPRNLYEDPISPCT